MTILHYSHIISRNMLNYFLALTHFDILAIVQRPVKAGLNNEIQDYSPQLKIHVKYNQKIENPTYTAFTVTLQYRWGEVEMILGNLCLVGCMANVRYSECTLHPSTQSVGRVENELNNGATMA